MYDFEGYNAANGLDWRAESRPGYPAAIYSYRDWAKGDECQLGPDELNRRLRILLRYYEWSVEEGYLDRIPFDTNAVFREDDPSRLVEHATSAGSRLAVPGWNGRLRFLIEEDNQRCLSILENETHRLQYRMMRETGLRQCECRTFPQALVVDPKTLSIPRNAYIGAWLDPRKMHIKNGTRRRIDISQKLMSDLHSYAVSERVWRSRAGEGRAQALFLTEAGRAFSPSGMQHTFERLSKRAGFHVHPHMLRHSYAMYTLEKLHRSKTFKGNPLLYVQARLGHASLQSTLVYLREWDLLNAELALAHEDEVDMLFED
jgi:integrase